MSHPTLLVIDNYDSFVWNLVDYVRALGETVMVRRNDAIDVAEAVALDIPVLLSPGPSTPDAAGVSLALVAACAAARRPLLGVCLGHQAIGQHFGAALVRSGPVHGKIAEVTHDGTGLFAGLPSPFQATRYHSLALAEVTAPLRVTAAVADGTVMAVTHATLPIHGVQFHPESIASEHGHRLLGNFLALARGEARLAA